MVVIKGTNVPNGDFINYEKVPTYQTEIIKDSNYINFRYMKWKFCYKSSKGFKFIKAIKKITYD